jgi:hypothetical protein
MKPKSNFLVERMAAGGTCSRFPEFGARRHRSLRGWVSTKHLFLAVLALQCTCLRGQQMLSPKLSQFLVDHPAASTALSNVLWEAQSAHPVHIYYFYASEKCHLPTTHRYFQDSSAVGIFVRENQPPSDECIDILFEALNLKGEKRFRELYDQARSGGISRKDYVREMQRQELQAVVAAKKLIGNFKLSQKEAAESWNYNTFMQSPTEFEKFVAYSSKVSQGQDQNYYEQQYDALRAKPQLQPRRAQPGGSSQ